MYHPSLPRLVVRIKGQPAFLIQLVDARGNKTNFVLKELWWHILACLVALPGISSGTCVYFTHHKACSGLKGPSGKCLLKASKAIYTSHKSLERGIKEQAVNRPKSMGRKRLGKGIQRK